MKATLKKFLPLIILCIAVFLLCSPSNDAKSEYKSTLERSQEKMIKGEKLTDSEKRVNRDFEKWRDEQQRNK